MEIHEIQESTKRIIDITDIENIPASPDTVTITVWKPDKTKDVDAVSMTEDYTGRYYYWYTISEQIGTHKILFTATTGGLITKQRDEFMAVAEQK